MSGSPRLPDTIETIPAALAFWAERTPDAPALRSLDGRTLGYRELWRATVGIVDRLRAIGIGPADRVAFVTPPGVDACTAVLGGMMGAIAVPLHADATAYELTRDLERLPPRLVVGDGAGAERVGAVAATLRIAAMSVADLVAPAEPLPRPSAAPVTVDPDGIAAILHTSGTTGYPKRVPRSHRALVVGARAMSARTGLAEDDVLLLAADLANIGGLGNLLNAMVSGGSCAVAPHFHPAEFARWLVVHRPTWTFLTPNRLRLLLDAAAGGAPLAGPRTRLRLLRVGSQPMTPELRERAERNLRAPMFDTYGMSEAHSISAPGPSPADRREGSVGRPLAVQLRVVDDAGAGVPAGTTGEVVVRGPTVMDGYLDDAEANAAAFTPDGWFRTGDLGYLDAEGFLFLTGRAKEQINRGGEQISPAEIDRVLVEHPAVAEAAAFGVPDDRLGEDVVAAVVVRVGMDVTVRELRRFLFDRLGLSRAPRRIWFVETLPRTATGKVRRGALTGHFLAASASQTREKPRDARRT